MPASPTALVGREAEREILAGHLTDPACRLITIIGPGGIGKTRLALEVAAGMIGRFLHGVYVIQLDAVSTAAELPATIARALGFSFYGKAPPATQLLSYLREKEVLLVLDNFEHLIAEGADLLAAILSGAHEVKLLVASRTRLQLQGECLLELQGLSIPPDIGATTIDSYGAVQLFLQRAGHIHPAFAPAAAEMRAIVRICRLLEGLPLGIELAAAWVRLLACAEIAQEIEHNLGFLTTTLRDVPPRHRSLRAVFDQSWQLLSPGERRVLRRLAVFRGGFTRAAAEIVCAEERTAPGNPCFEHRDHSLLRTLAALVDASLLRKGAIGRYEMHELIWQYSAGKLQEDSVEQIQALGQYSAAQQHYREALALYRAIGDTWEIAHVLNYLGNVAEVLGEYPEAKALYQESLTIFAGIGDRFCMARASNNLGLICYDRGEYTEAQRLYQNCLNLCRATGSQLGSAVALLNLGLVACTCKDYVQAQHLYQECLAIGKAIGDQKRVAAALCYLGIIAQIKGDYAEAQRCSRESLAIAEANGDRWTITKALTILGDLALGTGDYQASKGYFLRALKGAIEIQLLPRVMDILIGIAKLLARSGQTPSAIALLALPLYHPARKQNTLDQAQELLATLAVDLPSEAVAAALAEGRGRSLEEVVEAMV